MDPCPEILSKLLIKVLVVISGEVVKPTLKQANDSIGGMSCNDYSARFRAALGRRFSEPLGRLLTLDHGQQNQSSAQVWKESQLPARELGLQLHSMEVSSADKYESAFKEATKARSGALASTSNALANSNQKRIADLATKNRLPAIYPREDWITNGGLMSYGPDRADVYKRVAVFVDKILKGTKPADLPVEQPTKFEFIINLKAAKQIGLTIPPNVLARADRVIK
jgi:ABC-type uncharacterized transport system substrate-binding protein